MAESLDGKRNRRARGGKRTISSLGELANAPELQNLPERAPEPEPEAPAMTAVETAPEITAENVTPAQAEQDVADLRDAIVEQSDDTPALSPQEAAAPAEAEPVQEPGVETRGSGEANEPLAEDAQEWEMLMRDKPEGDDVAFGRKVWHSKDGGIFLSRRNARTPQYLAHGDPISFKTGQRAGETWYWDTNANGFTEARPEGVQDPTEQVGQKKRATSRAERMEKPFSDATRETRQHNLRHTLSTLNVDDDTRGKFSQAIDAVRNRAHVEAVLNVMKEFMPKEEPRARERAAEEPAPEAVAESQVETAAPAEAPAPVDDRAEQISASEKRIRDEVRNKKKELRTRLVGLRDQNVISQAFYDMMRSEVQKAKYTQELSGVEADVTRWESAAPEHVPEAAPAASEAHEAAASVAESVLAESPAPAEQQPEAHEAAAAIAQDILNESPTPPNEIESLIKRLASRTPEERKKMMRLRDEQARQNPEAQELPVEEAEQTAGRARPSHQELSDFLTGKHDGQEAVPAAGNDGVERPRVSAPSEALRHPDAPAHDEGNESVNKYAIDKRNYIGLPIMSVQEILADKTHQQFFGELIHSINPAEAAAIQLRYAQGAATQEDMSFMTYAAHEYSKWNHMWSELVEHMSEVDVDMFARRTPALHNIVAHVKGPRGLEILKNALRHAAMTDQDTFLAVEHATHEAHGLRDSKLGIIANGKIEAIAARVGIDRKDFENVFDFSSPEAEEATHKHVVELLRAKAGGGRRAMDWLSRFSPTPLVGSSEIAADNIVASAKAALKGRFGITGKRLNSLGHSIEHAAEGLGNIIGTRDITEQVTSETLENAKRPEAYELGVVNFRETMVEAQKAPEIVEKQIQERIKNDPQWETGGRAYQDSVFSSMKAEAKKKVKNNGGFWSWLLVTLVGTSFDKAASKAAGRPVHVH